MARYTPPRQSKFGQVIDVLVLLVLTIGTLYIPLWMGLAGSATQSVPVENPTWESLGQNATMVERWNALGFAEAADAAGIITSRFDYSFSWLNMLIMVVVVVGYYVLLIKFSDSEYREVISEKFGDRK